MEEDLTKLLLAGLTRTEFIAFFIWGVVGMIMSFGFSVIYNTKVKDKESWNWKKLWSGGKRFGLGLLTVAAGVIFFEKLAGFMLDSDAPIKLTQWGALTIVGLGSDRLAKVFASFIPKKK